VSLADERLCFGAVIGLALRIFFLVQYERTCLGDL
jgi:hypothetical protein